MRRVALHTLGCKLNYAETSTIAEGFRREGFDVVPFGSASDVTVINSCTVTENADRECRQIVRRALRANPQSFVVVTGCYAQLQPEEIASIDGVDLVLGSAEKFRILEIEHSFRKQETPRIRVEEIDAADSFGPAATGGSDERTRAFLKVQDGCDYSCSFCTIPLARGASRSHSIAAAVSNARSLVSAGYREIVLTGVNVGDFGKGRGESLYDLLVALHDVDRLERLKISSIEPNLLEDRIIELAASSDRMIPHFHLPLQSGSNLLLGRMRRRYRRELYAERVSTILSALPDAAIGVDLIVGFPGEGAEEFEDSTAFVRNLPVAYFHVFTYSERTNTPAAEFGLVVPVAERRARTRRLRALSERKKRHFAERFIGSTRPVLFEREIEEQSGAVVEGLTDNYVRVCVPYRSGLVNTIAAVTIGACDGDRCVGTLAGEPDLPTLPRLNVIG